MIALAFLAVAAARPVAEAERAFAAAAERDGQWTAFRAFAAPDAIMVVPAIARAHDFLADRKDPPRSVRWWPDRTVTACDRSLAFSTGPWIGADGHQTGRFFTIWRRQPDGTWRWIYDGGTDTPGAVPAADKGVAARRASCRRRDAVAAPATAGGTSPDGTLRWRLETLGTRYRLQVEYSDGEGWRTALDEQVGG